MTKNLKSLTKMLLIPTLVIGGLSACGYNHGARTHNYDGARTHNYDGVRPYSTGGVGTYNNNNYDGTRSYNNGMGMTPYNGAGVNSYNYDGARPYNNYGGTNSYNYDGNRQYPNSAYNYNYGTGTYTGDGTSFTHAQNKRVASAAVDVAKHVHGVTKATAIAHGKDIVVGIDVKKGSKLKEVEQNVRQKVQAKEPGFKVHVTSDAKIHQRIQTIYTTMSNYSTNTMNNTNYNAGHPVRALGTDVANVIRDIGRTVTAPFR